MTTKVAFSFSVQITAPLADVRRWVVESVIGDGGSPAAGGRLTVLEDGPSRYASRFRAGDVQQLRVVEWVDDVHADGAVLHSLRGELHLAARYRLSLSRAGARTSVACKYSVETPLLGLGVSLRFSRTRSLARRLARAWLRLEDERAWSAARVHRQSA
jgi:hypothetical protein